MTQMLQDRSFDLIFLQRPYILCAVERHACHPWQIFKFSFPVSSVRERWWLIPSFFLHSPFPMFWMGYIHIYMYIYMYIYIYIYRSNHTDIILQYLSFSFNISVLIILDLPLISARFSLLAVTCSFPFEFLSSRKYDGSLFTSTRICWLFNPFSV